MPFKYMHHNRELNFWEKMYYPEIAKGLGVTARQFLRNFFGKRDTVTKQYPEERFPMSYRARNRHYLTKRSDGRLSCVACMMCSFACPSNCISIEIGELEEPYYTERQKVDRYPVTFTINQLTCIYCGFCVEACPEDAIRMDSGKPMMATYERDDAVMTIDLLSEDPKAEHERIYNPVSGQEPAEAPLAVIDSDKVKKREY